MFLKNNNLVFMYEDYLKTTKNLSKSSIVAYVTSAKAFLTEGNDPYKLEDYNDFLIRKVIKSRSNIHYTALKFFIKSLPDMDRNEKNRITESLIQPRKFSMPKVERQYLSESKLIQIINYITKEKHKVIALIQYLTGVRAGDVLKTQRGNIVPELYNGKAVLKFIIMGKGDKRNIVYIHDETAQQIIINYIIKHFNHTDYYFMEDTSRVKKHSKVFADFAFYKTNFRRYLRDLHQALDRMGIDKRTFASHDYRRCFARRVWTKFKDLQVLQDLLNHSSPSTTMLYLRNSGLKMVDYQKQMQE